MKNLTVEELIDLPRYQSKVLCNDIALTTCLIGCEEELAKKNTEEIFDYIKNNNFLFVCQKVSNKDFPATTKVYIEYMNLDSKIVVRLFYMSNKVIIYTRVEDDLDFYKPEKEIKFNGCINNVEQLKTVLELIN